jgi:hypothetical protein
LGQRHSFWPLLAWDHQQSRNRQAKQDAEAPAESQPRVSDRIEK